MNPKKKQKKRNSKNIYILSFFAIIIGMIIASALYQSQPVHRMSSDEYFAVTGAIIVDADLERSTDQVLFITQIRFNLTAVKGDAHHVLFMVTGMTSQQDWPYFPEIPKNKTVTVLIPTLTYPYRSIKRSDGYFPFPIRIDSVEATGSITVLLKD